jgi:RluA family pseudouridine synthase
MKIKPERLVIWIDEHLLAINKPSGLPTLPDGYDHKAPHVKSVMEPHAGPLWIVHRLDRDTSGLLLLARSAEAHRHLNMQFESRQTHKVYHTLVKGSPEWEENRVDLPLRPDADREHRTLVDHRSGKSAITHLKVLARYGAYSLIEALPETGRTHQIRAHLSSVGFPIAADSLYGDGEPLYLSHLKPDYRKGKGAERPLLARLGLHAYQLGFTHPIEKTPMELIAPYAKDFGAVVTQLSKPESEPESESEE